MNNKTQNIKALKGKIATILQKEIGEKSVCILDLPNYFNPGDQLIWEGEEQIIKQLNRNIKYRSSLYYFNPAQISNEDCIFLQGGGNFGDLYKKHQDFKEYILNKFPKNKIIIFSCTIHFSNKNNLKKTAELFSKHPNVTIFSRDKNSIKVIQDNFKNTKYYLVPDMAFSVENLKKTTKDSTEKKALFLLRKDKEKNSFQATSLDFVKNLKISDWPIYTQSDIRIILLLLNRAINNILFTCLKLLGFHWNKKNDVYGLIKFHSKEKQINTAVNFFSQYDLIVTTRLHGHILACLLGIPNILLNNSYGKNKNFYDTWMKNNSLNAYYANSPKDVYNIIENNFPEFIK